MSDLVNGESYYGYKQVHGLYYEGYNKILGLAPLRKSMRESLRNGAGFIAY